MVVTLFIGAC